MTCEEARELLHAFVDGELDLVHHARIEAHLGECEACGPLLEGVQGVRSAVASAGLSFEPPARLEAAVRATLRRGERSRAARLPAPGRVLQLGAALAAGLALGLFLRGSVHEDSISRQDSISREAVANHVRSLMAHHLADVESTDQHTVKPWFEGKLAFAPRVRDFAAEGFPLVGGRLDYLGGRPVAALVYKRRQHAINLFVWPSDGDADEAVSRTAAREGYTVLRWASGGARCALVSDVVASDLEQLAALLRQP